MMNEGLDIRRKRLLFRSWHRGMKEADLLLGSFAEQHLAGLTAQQVVKYEALIEESDAMILDWIMGRTPAPAEHDSDVLHLLMRFRYTPRSA